VDLAKLYYLVTSIVFLSTLLFAAVAGRTPERWGAGMVFTALLMTWISGNVETVLNLAIDATLAIALLVLFFFHRRFWVACAFCAQTMLLAFSSSRLIEFPLSAFEYVLALNVSSIMVFGSLLLGTVASRWGPPADAEPLDRVARVPG
jgi:hypothetical protein